MCRLVCALVLVAHASAEDGTLPSEEKVSFQSAFPQSPGLRLPSFMDVFASMTQKDYINVGLKWKVTESRAAMAYAVRLSAGHKPIPLKTDDYHIEAFSKGDKPAPNDFTKIRFRQKGTYSGSLGYAAPVLDKKETGLFMLWDNKKKAHARMHLGSLIAEKNIFIKGKGKMKGKLTNSAGISSKKKSTFAGTIIGKGYVEAPAAIPLMLLTKPKGGKADPKKPPFFMKDNGFIGIGGQTKPTASLHVVAKSKKGTALRIEVGAVSFGSQSVMAVDGAVKGKKVKGLRLKMLRNGNIGINQLKPTEKLHVGGGVKIDSAAMKMKSKATLFVSNTLTKCDEHTLRVRNHFYVSACGRVGVKTPKPMADFHVTGTTKTTALEVDKNVKVKGITTLHELAPLKGLLAAKNLRIDSKATFRGKVQVDDDLVVKGNLFVMKEVKMIGGGGGKAEEIMAQMMESRLALIEESHATLKNHNDKLHARVQELETQLAKR